MNIYVGVTDNDWYRYLADLKPDEVNFWQPGGSQRFRALSPGQPFLFKLKAPYNHIAGGGFFVSHTFLPVSVAWETFGKKNGMPDYWSFAAKIRGYRADYQPNPTIGCIVLSDVFFINENEWIPVPPSWSRNIVSGKTYNLQEADGQYLWQEVQSRFRQQNLSAENQTELPLVADPQAKYGNEYLTRARLGQGAFRVLVTDAYGRRCAFTGERTLPALQAAHIKPYAVSGPHRVSNGLLLRADLHQLFDKGYVTLTSDLHIEVSNRIKEEFENGREYYALHGQQLRSLPSTQHDCPSQDFIGYHNENIFVP